MPKIEDMSVGEYKVVLDINMLIDGEPYLRKRTWKERKISEPCNKFIKVTPRIPDPNGRVYGDILRLHPEAWAKLKLRIAND
jgi:hypothetical protein